MRLQKSDFEVHGYTSGCAGSRALIRKLPPQSHNESCRRRLEQLLREPEDGVRRENLADARINQRLAGELEENDKNKMKTHEEIKEGEVAAPDKSNDQGGLKRALDDGELTLPAAVRRCEEGPLRKHWIDPPGDEPPDRRMRVSDTVAGSSTDVRIEELFESDMCEPDNQVFVQAMRKMEDHYDDGSGEWLDPRLVEEGCAEEMRRFQEMGVYEHILREEA